MVSPSSDRLRQGVAGALFVLSIVVFLPSSAEAGCGHDVTSNVGRSIQKSFSDLEMLKYSAADLSEPASSSPRRGRPCSGPSCSRDRGFPNAPLPYVLPRHERWCLSSQAAPPIGAERFGRVSGDAPLHVIHFALILERPPRAELNTLVVLINA